MKFNISLIEFIGYTMEFLVRPNNKQKIYLSETSMDVVEILRDEYGYIYDSILKENFLIKSPYCNLFKEIVFDSKVVGFCSYDHSREFLTAALNNIYIIPQYWGNGLFLKELLKTMDEYQKPSIVEPTRLVVELLISYGFAKKVGESIVASSIEFIVPGEHVLSNIEYDSKRNWQPISMI